MLPYKYFCLQPWWSGRSRHRSCGTPRCVNNVQVPKDLCSVSPFPAEDESSIFRYMCLHNTKPKQKPTYSSGNAVHTIFAFALTSFNLKFPGADVKKLQEFPGSLVVETLCASFLSMGPGSHWSEN